MAVAAPRVAGCPRPRRGAPAPRAPSMAPPPGRDGGATHGKPRFRRRPPAPSCGPPETRPVAMPGPKIPRPRSESAASTIAMASSMVGVTPPNPAVNWPKSVEPIPMITGEYQHLDAGRRRRCPAPARP